MLVDAALPGAARIGKEYLDREPLEHLLVLEQLFGSDVYRKGFPRQR
jgi:hypothetical protein